MKKKYKYLHDLEMAFNLQIPLIKIKDSLKERRTLEWISFLFLISEPCIPHLVSQNLVKKSFAFQDGKLPILLKEENIFFAIACLWNK